MHRIRKEKRSYIFHRAPIQLIVNLVVVVPVHRCQRLWLLLIAIIVPRTQSGPLAAAHDLTISYTTAAAAATVQLLVLQ